MVWLPKNRKRHHCWVDWISFKLSTLLLTIPILVSDLHLPFQGTSASIDRGRPFVRGNCCEREDTGSILLAARCQRGGDRSWIFRFDRVHRCIRSSDGYFGSANGISFHAMELI
jgi:hypothetical protein